MPDWLIMLSDPNHWIADGIMNIAFELTFAWITYRAILKHLNKKAKGKRKK